MAEQAEKTLSAEEKRLNRQINHFVMRYMWQVVRGRKREDTHTIYVELGTSRERYTRAINTGMVRYGKEELITLQRQTGLRGEIFTGEVRFKCPYTVKLKDKDDTGETLKVPDITTEEWEQLFKWRQERKNLSEGSDQQGNCQTDIYEKLKTVCRTDSTNWDFYSLCYFLQSENAVSSRPSLVKIKEIEASMKGMTFSLLDGCELEQLKSFHKLLKEKSSMVSAMITYKSAREASKKKK